MKKKIMTISLVVALAAIAIVGGTLAYFTDTDDAVNEFTVGNVKIDLHEANKEDPAAVDEEYHTWLKDQVLMPGDTQTNTVAKRVYVENTGKSDAYVRVHIAIPSVLDNAQPDFDASKNLLHFNNSDESMAVGKWNWGTKIVADRNGYTAAGDTWNFYTTKVNNIEYNVYVVTYETALAPKDVTMDAMHQVYLYKDVTNEDIEKADKTLNGNWNILVFAEGGQVEGFDNAFSALNTQFGNPMADGYVAPWNKTSN